MTAGRPAVFFDRDGVLNETLFRDGQPASPRSRADLTLVPDLAAVARVRAAGFLTFIVTNQPDVTRGNISTAELDAIHAAILAIARMDEVRYCPHEDADDCDCRKPKPGMLLDLARHWHVDLARSWMVGDMWRDVGAARAAGCRSVLLRRDYNRDVRADIEVTTLAEAVAQVLEQSGGAV